jgi:hypothetical protein
MRGFRHGGALVGGMAASRTHWGTSTFALGLALALLGVRSASADEITIGGAVSTPLSLNDDALGGTAESAMIGGVSYSGSSVYSLIQAANFQPDPAQSKNGNLLDYLVLTGTDGQSVVLSEGQLDPSFGGQPGNPPIFIATSANGSPIAPRLIVQTDPNGTTDGYDITGVSNITVGQAAVPALSNSALNTQSAFTVTGAGAGSSTASYNTSNFPSVFPTQTTQMDNYLSGSTPTMTTFTGVPIFTLLQNAGLTPDPTDLQAILDEYIVVTGSNEPTMGVDDYAVLYSLGEIDPAYNDFTSSTVPLLAEVGGTTFRSTAPSDEKGGRYNSDVVNINVVDPVPEPGSISLLAAGLLSLGLMMRRRRA